MTHKNQTVTTLDRFKAATLAAILLLSFGMASIVSADSYDDQINQLQNQNAATQTALSGLMGQASTYQEAINQLAAQIAGVQAQITANEAEQARLQGEIVANQQKIEDKKASLGASVKAMYLDGQMSTIEQLATSKNLSDYIDKEEYRTAVQNQLNTALKEIAALQLQLQKQKADLDVLISSQKVQRDQLATAEAEQSQLLAYNQSQQDAYGAQLKANNSKISQLRSQQRAAYSSLTGSGGRSPVGSAIKYKNMTGPQSCGGDYRYCWTTYLDQPVNDPWGFGYARECVHYVLSTLANNGNYIPRFPAGGGNAYNWVPYTTSIGAASLVSDPQPGDVVYMPIAPLGHVGMVDYVNDDGTVHVSQYNWYPGMYNTMDLYITSGIQFLRFH